MEHFFICPYCWQQISFILECEIGSHHYTEDCEVCCNPVEVNYEFCGGEVINFTAEKTQ